MNTSPKLRIQATACLLAAVFMWSTIPLFLRSFIDEIDFWTANGMRYLFAMLFWLGPLLYFASKGWLKREYWLRAIVPAIVNLLSQLFWAMGPYYLEPGVLMFLGRISIVFALIFSFILFADELALVKSKTFWTGLLICLSGFVMMNWFSGILWSPVSRTGLVVVLCNAFFISMYGVSVRYWMQGIKPWISFPIICIYTAIGLIILMALFGQPSDVLAMSPGRIGVLILSAFIGIAWAHTFYYFAIEHIGVSISSGTSLITPFLTSIGSYFIFREVFSSGQWAAGVMIFAGALLLLSAQRHLGKRHEPVPTGNYPELEEFDSIEQDGDEDSAR